MKFIYLPLALLAATTAFAVDDEVSVFELNKGDVVSQVLMENLSEGTRMYAPSTILMEVLRLNGWTLESSRQLPVGTKMKVPRKYLKVASVPSAEPEPEVVPVEETVSSTLRHSFRLLLGTHLYNRNDAKAGAADVFTERFLQPVVGIEHRLDREAWSLRSAFLLTKQPAADPELPIEFNLNEGLSLGPWYLHLRYDQHSYYTKSVSDPAVETNRSFLAGGGLNYETKVLGQETEMQLFYLRSLSSKSGGRGLTENSFNLNSSTRLQGPFGLDFQLQYNNYSASNFDLREIRVLSTLGWSI